MFIITESKKYTLKHLAEVCEARRTRKQKLRTPVGGAVDKPESLRLTVSNWLFLSSQVSTLKTWFQHRGAWWGGNGCQIRTVQRDSQFSGDRLYKVWESFTFFQPQITLYLNLQEAPGWLCMCNAMRMKVRSDWDRGKGVVGETEKTSAPLWNPHKRTKQQNNSHMAQCLPFSLTARYCWVKLHETKPCL